MPTYSPSVILKLVDKLYAAAVDPAQWGVLLSSAAEAVGADHAFVCQLDHYSQSLNYVGLQLNNRSKVPVRRYGRLLGDDPRRVIFDAHKGVAAHCRMGLTDARLRDSKTYKNYLQPLDIEYTMVTCIPVRDGFSHDLGFTRTRDRTSFGADDCDLMNQLAAHLQRAFEITRALEDKSPQLLISLPHLDYQKLQNSFALSATQARLAMQLYSGKSVRDAAQDLQITEGTARQYLKKIFAKTGAKRQYDLFRLIERFLKREV